jgi:TolB-like protein/DNA-binding winged helix-turn-helix (wHTH) protein/Tfp pilus assembly protein PilF
MGISTPPARVIRFGIFELDAESGELRRHGLKVRLPDQAFQILRLLLARPGEVVTREEVRQRLWTSDTFVDFDVGLNSAIRKLREALDDSAENPRFVETLPRRGYRFVATVQPAAPDQVSGAPTDSVAPARPRARLWWVAAGLLLVAAIAAPGVVYQGGWLDRQRPGAAAGPVGSLVVLPFENLTGDPAQEYIVDAVTDALTTDLAQIDGLRVISRTSARQYKRSAKLSPAIGDELKVDAVLEGSVTRAGRQVRVTAQLIHAATDRHLWARSYDGEFTDVVRLQQRVAGEIAASIGRRFAPPAAGRREVRNVNPEAYDAYLKGVFAGGRVSYEGFRTAVAYFEEAIARQPDFAEAYAALAQAQHQFLFVGPLSPRETMPKAEAAARKALALDDTLAQAHQTLGGVLHHLYWQWEEGDKEFERARQLSADAPANRAAGVPALIRNGRFEEAIALTERARKDDPLSFSTSMNLATAYRAAGQYDQAVAEIRRGLGIAPEHPRGHFQLGVTFSFMGRSTDAIAELETAVRSATSGNPMFQAYLGYAYAAAGRPLDARRIATQLEARARKQYVSGFGLALIYDALGEKEPALAAFERAYQDRAVEFSLMTQYPPFKTIASDPRFQKRMREIGLPR